MIESIFNFSRAFHIFLGFWALITFWGALLIRPKGIWHRRLGTSFFIAMIGLSLSAFILSYLTFNFIEVIHPDWLEMEAKAFSLFLSGLGFASAIGCLNGWIAANRPHRVINLPTITANCILLVVSLVLFGIAAHWSQVIIALAGALGLNISLPYLKESYRRSSKSWKVIHIQYMMGAGIAVHTAFVAGGGSRFMPNYITELGWMGWLLPTLLFQPLIYFTLKRLQ